MAEKCFHYRFREFHLPQLIDRGTFFTTVVLPANVSSADVVVWHLKIVRNQKELGSIQRKDNFLRIVLDSVSVARLLCLMGANVTHGGIANFLTGIQVFASAARKSIFSVVVKR